MCEFCGKVKKLNKDNCFMILHSGNTEMILRIDYKKRFFIEVESTDNLFDYEIFNCPLCGKKLSELLGEE